jgi:hypothetical protein
VEAEFEPVPKITINFAGYGHENFYLSAPSEALSKTSGGSISASLRGSGYIVKEWRIDGYNAASHVTILNNGGSLDSVEFTMQFFADFIHEKTGGYISLGQHIITAVVLAEGTETPVYSKNITFTVIE